MSTKLEIFNMALAHLGMKSVASTTGTDPSTVAANAFYQPSLDDLFREARLPFCTLLAELTTSTATVVGYDYVYEYPTNAATVWSVFDEGTVDRREQQEFEVMLALVGTASTETKVVCSNLADAYGEYTYKVTDTSLFDPKFTLAFSYRLASNMAHTLIGDVEKGLKLLEISNAILSEAKRINSVEKIKKPIQESGYVNSRG